MQHLKIDHLTTFLTVHRLGGVRRAALHLNITQPAVTARIQKLEAALDAELFERSSTGLTLTKSGEALLPHAKQFEALVDRIEEGVMAPDALERRLRLGASETIAQCWLPELVAALHTRYPKLEVEIDVDISLNLRNGLLAREIDLAFLLGPVSEYSVDNVALPGFALDWFVAADTPCEGDARRLHEQPVVTYARGTRPHHELQRELVERIGPGVPMFPSSSLSACFRLVEAGLGVGALPRSLARDKLAEGTLRIFDPGWRPNDLQFTASYLSEPRVHIVETAAQLARELAVAWSANHED